MHEPVTFQPVRALPLLAMMTLGFLSSCAPPAPPDIALSELGAPYAHARCEVTRNCYDDLATATLVGTGTSAGCEALVQGQFENRDLPRYQRAIATGTLVYHPSRAPACVDSLVTTGCAFFAMRATPECDALFTGTVAIGDPCALDEECEGDAYCNLDLPCPGTCTSRSAIGGACTSSSGCVSGLFCGPDHTCIPPTEILGACDPAASVCEGTLLCSNEHCVDASGTYGSWVEDRARALCAGGRAMMCHGGFSCATPAEAFTCGIWGDGTCHPGVPDPCPVGQYCAGADTAAGDYDGTCAPLPTEGMPCVLLVAQLQCADGYVCDRGHCTALQINGAPCAANIGCYSGNCYGGTCAAPPACL